jgi:universal stress protein E
MIYPIRTIVAAVATLDEQDPVLASAWAVAERTGARLEVVHAFELPDLVWDAYARMGYMDGDALRQYGDRVRVRLEERVREVTDSPRVRCRALVGPPAPVIQEVAAHVQADLVIVGATRRGALSRAILGTTAQRVLRGATAPVLVLRTPVPAGVRRVLLTTDLSPFSAASHEIGLDVVESLYRDDRPELRSLLVIWYGMTLPPPLRQDLLAEVAATQLDDFLGRRRERASGVEGVIRYGDPAKEIAAAAAEWEPDLLVMGTHGREGSKRFLLGSVAEGALRSARCNVLVVPPAAAERMSLPVPAGQRALATKTKAN